MTELKNSKKIYLGKTPDGRDRFALDVVAGDPTLEVQVGASVDDAHELESTGAMDVTSIAIYIRSNADSYNRYWGGFRFVSASFPAMGTTIDVAYLRVLPYHVNYDDANFNIHFEELAAPAAFTTDAGNITGRDRTEASVSWIADGLGADWVNSPSLCGVGSPAQELFDAYSPTTIVVITRPNQDANKLFYPLSWDNTGNVSGAILHLEWTVAATQQAVGDGSIAIAGTLGLLSKIVIGAGSITIAGSLARKIAISIGAGSIAISGALSSALKQLANVGSGSIAIAGSLGRKAAIGVGQGAIAISGALSSILRFIQRVGSGYPYTYPFPYDDSPTIAGTLGRNIKTVVGAASMTITGALGRKTAISIGAGAVSIAGALGLKVKLAMGGGAVGIASTLGRWIAISLAGSITPTGSLGRKIALSVGAGTISLAGALGRKIKLAVGDGLVSIASILGHFFFIDWQRGAIIHSGSIPSLIMLIEAVTKGDALGYDSGWKRAWAKSGSVVQFRCVAAEDGIKNQTITAYFGTVLLGGRFAGGIAGRPVYVEEGTRKGRYTLTKPTTAGDADTVIGYMLTGSLAFIHSSLNDDSTV